MSPSLLEDWHAARPRGSLSCDSWKAPGELRLPGQKYLAPQSVLLPSICSIWTASCVIGRLCNGMSLTWSLYWFMHGYSHPVNVLKKWGANFSKLKRSSLWYMKSYKKRMQEISKVSLEQEVAVYLLEAGSTGRTLQRVFWQWCY